MKNFLFDGFGRVIPMNALSFITGAASRVELPGPFNKLLCKGFASSFGIDLTEAEQPLEAYRSIEDLFTRKLKEGARVIQGEPCSPADGILSIAGPAVNNSAVQAKGLTYSLSELMFGHKGEQETAKLAYYATIYLAPHNYHRVHSPVSGYLSAARYFPGELWPVNKPSVRWTPRLFTRNERLVFDIKTPDGNLYLAMVGALNVGRMVSPHLPDFSSNETRFSLAKKGPRDFVLREGHKIVCGEELGTFMLGSTVIIAFDEALAKRYRMQQAWSSRPILMGEKLGDRS
jgi:phosphatidylserine decarboxylase